MDALLEKIIMFLFTFGNALVIFKFFTEMINKDWSKRYEPCHEKTNNVVSEQV